jgi:hypothetical protein
MTPVEHLGRALQAIEADMCDLEHRADWVRSAIEAFGVDADGLLLDLAKEDAGIIDIDHDEDDIAAQFWADLARAKAPQATNPTALYRDGKRWNWPNIAALIGRIDAGGERRVAGLVNELDVSDATAQWMVKRCRELSLIDLERPAFTEQNARDRAAAAI